MLNKNRILAGTVALIMAANIPLAAMATVENLVVNTPVTYTVENENILGTGGNPAIIAENGANVLVTNDTETPLKVDSNAPSYTVIVNDASVSIDGSILNGTESGIKLTGTNEQANAAISGNIIAMGSGIVASNAQASLDGSINATYGTGIDARNNSTVSMGSSILEAYDGVNAVTGSQVTVADDVYAQRAGVTAIGTGTSVAVGGDVKGEDDYGVYAFDSAVVTVGGDVESGNRNGISVGQLASVTVTGNVNAGDKGIVSSDSTVSVGGNVVSTPTEYGIVATNSTVTVDGSVTATGGYAAIEAINSEVTVGNGISGTMDGIQASKGSTVTVTGNVSGQYRQGVYASDDNTTVTVDGDVLGANGVTIKTGAEVTVSGNVSSTALVVNADGQNSHVEIDGNATISGDHTTAIQAFNGTDVLVHGALTATGTRSFGVDARNSTVTIDSGVTSDNVSIYTLENAVVTVTGDVVSHSERAIYNDHSTVTVNGDASSAGDNETVAYANNSGSITVQGSVTATGIGGKGIGADVDSTVSVGGNVTSNSVAVDISQSSLVTVDGDVTSFNSWGIRASEESTVTVGGSVAGEYGVDAYHNSSVTVNGNVSSGLDGILAKDESKIDIGGDVTVSASACTAVNAETKSSISIDGSVSATDTDSRGVKASFDSSVTVGKDITSDVEAVVALDHSTVTVGGDVSSNLGTSVDASEASTVTVDGSVTGLFGIDVNHNTSVTVGGDVSSRADGIVARDESTVDVGGDVTTTGYSATAVAAEMKSEITIEGSVSATGTDSNGICAESNASITVGGDVTASGTGVTLAGATIIVGGDISANGDNAVEIAIGAKGHLEADTITGGDDSTFLIVAEGMTESDVLSKLPEVMIFEAVVESGAELVEISNTAMTEEEKADLAEVVAKTMVDYIIKTHSDHGTMTLVGATKTADGRYVAKEDAEITVNMVVDSGYELNNVTGGKATVTKNADGSYTVTVPRGGGVDIVALFQAVIQSEQSDEQGGSTAPIVTPSKPSVPKAPAAGTKQETAVPNGVLLLNGQVAVLKQMAAEGNYIAVVESIDGEELPGAPRQLTTEQKLALLTNAQLAVVNTVDGGNLSNVTGVTFPTGSKVVAPTIAFVCDPESPVTLYSSKLVTRVKVLYLDPFRNEWRVLDAEVDEATGLITFTAPMGGLVTLLEY